MMSIRYLGRLRRAAAFGLLGLCAGLCPVALAAQDNSTIGNPQLRDFQLPGQRTTPPVQPQPVTTAPPPATTRPAPTTTAPASTTAPPSATNARTTRASTRRPAAEAAARPAVPSAGTATPPPSAAPAPVTTVPLATPTMQQSPLQTAPPAAPAPQQAAPAPEPASSGFNPNWLWLALPLLLALGAAAFLRRRRALAERDEEDRGALAGALVPGERPQPAAPPAAAPEAPTAAAEPAELELAGAAPPEAAERPWLELDIEPDRAANTESEASLDYNLVVTNVGDAPARNIRIDTRMFNAADEQEIAGFLGGALHRHSGSPHVSIPPGESLRLTAVITMKAEEVRAIELQGRRIFVPSVAINVAYDWGEDGEGRTSKSWLVGRKAENPAARMGAFRLDLGPRIYRSVGRKDTKRVMV
jgi:hypothetical protein